MRITKFTFYQQLDRMDCGPCCLQMILKFYTREKYKITYLRYLCDVGKDGCSLFSINTAAESFGLNGRGYELDINELVEFECLPSILSWNDDHFVILYRISRDFFGNRKFFIADPYKGKYVLNESEIGRAHV